MVTVALSVSVFMLMLTGGFFAGPNLVLWFYFGITPATIFLITVVIINLLPGWKAEYQRRKSSKALLKTLDNAWVNRDKNRRESK